MMPTTAMARHRKMMGVVLPTREAMMFLLMSCSLSVVLYPYSRMIRPIRNRAMEPDRPLSVVGWRSARYTRNPGIRNSRDMAMISRPRGIMNLFLLSGSDSILLMM